MHPRVAAGVVACVTALAAAGCGHDNTPIVHVGQTVITRGDFEHELHTGDGTALPHPPNYTKCIESLGGGAGGPRDATLRGRCQYRYVRSVQAALGELIHVSWARAEAKAEGVALSDADRARVKKEFADGGRHDPSWVIEGVALDRKLQARQPQVKVAGATLRAVERRQISIRAKRRDVVAIATSSATDARQALRDVETGVPIPTVAARYASAWRSLFGTSIPVGRLDDVTSNPRKDASGLVVDPRLRAAVFASAFNDITGPVRVGRGWYVLDPVEERGPIEQGNAKAFRRTLVVALRRDQRMAGYETLLARHWLAKTTCRHGYVVGSGALLLGGLAMDYYSTAGCGNYVPFRTPPPR